MRRAIVYLLLVSCFATCKKNNDKSFEDNELQAIVLLSSGDTIIFRANGPKVIMGCGGLGTYLQGTSEGDAAITLSIVNSGNGCIKSPGTYPVGCEYRVYIFNPAAAIYSGLGDITFTSISDQYMEGHFDVVCRCYPPGCLPSADSLVIRGSFKGR